MERAMLVASDASTLEPEALCRRIGTLTTQMMTFWKSADEWAPAEAAGLLSKSMLEAQASLSLSLLHWLSASSQGDLILAWVNLGTLVEGQLKLLLSVYYCDYLKDPAAKDKKGKLPDPDCLMLNSLRNFFVKRIWTSGADWNPYVERVQQRRNAIHAFKYQDIGSFSAWRAELPFHLSFVRDINARLPYPDDIYLPREI
jgi:hypothetical protein